MMGKKPWSPDLTLPPVPGMGIPTAPPDPGDDITPEAVAAIQEKADKVLSQDVYEPVAPPAPGEGVYTGYIEGQEKAVWHPDNAKLVERWHNAVTVGLLKPMTETGNALATALEALRKENERLKSIGDNYFYVRGQLSKLGELHGAKAEIEALRKECKMHEAGVDTGKRYATKLHAELGEAQARIAELEEERDDLLQRVYMWETSTPTEQDRDNWLARLFNWRAKAGAKDPLC